MADFEKVLKRIPDDVVEYNIYPGIPSDIYDEEEIRVYLEKQQDAIFAHISNKIVNFIWQHEPFNLRPVPAEDPPHLHGSTNFGDNIDDEWFIVALLYELTREFAGMVVTVNDNDEEFLLIEAAESLPKWLNPETAENRVYVYNGDLHIIPIPQTPEESAKYPMFTPTLSEGLECIRDCACETRCSQAVQNCINKRLSQFPRKLKENIHNVNCYLPISMAALLSEQPSLVSEGVRRFYFRDPLELKACRPMKRFSPKDLVRTRIKMTRCLYAQLVQQEFTPDRRDCWPIVSPSSHEFLERDIGMKLAHGFEILCYKCPDDNGIASNDRTRSDNDPRWQKFKGSLANKGFFRNEIEGSKLYKQLHQEAKQFFLSHISSDESNFEDVGLKVMKLIKKLEPTFVHLRNQQQDLPPSDDDSWLNVTPEQLEEMMKSAGSVTSSSSSETFDLSKIAESMNAFVDHESGIDGAEFPKDCKEEIDGDGQFQSSGLIHQMQKIFEFADEDSSGSEMSEYDWSDNSEDDTGSPTKMPMSDIRRSSKPSSKVLRSNLKKKPIEKELKSKSVRFSAPDNPCPTTGKADSSPSSLIALVPEDTKTTRPPTVPARPEKLHVLSPTARPNRPPPPRPSNPGSRPSATPPPPPPPSSQPSKPARPLSKPNPTVKPTAPPPPPPPRPKRDKKLEALMDAMDRELAGTEVGKSFERMPVQKKDNKTVHNGKRAPDPRDIDDEDDDFCPVNVNLNVVKNTLESFKAQQGLPGPGTNILSGFGIKIPQDNGKT